MTEALHTKYRPQTFKEVVGHDATIRALKKVVKEGRARTFIFTGGSGLGKTTLARILANEFALRETDDKEAKATLANIIEIDAATHTGVDAMRQVVQKAQYRAIGASPVKGIIVDEAHRISAQAWDSMLKAIEEPPAHVYWFFCTTNAAKIPKTIKTRCLDFDLKPLTEDELLVVLDDVMKQAELKVDDEILELIAESSGGSPRQALIYLEKVQYCESVSEARQAMKTAGENKDVNDLMQLLLRRGQWRDAMAICKDLEEANADAEGIRIVACNYLAKVVANKKEGKQARDVLRIMECFKDPYDQATKYAPLYLSIGLALELDRR